MRNEGRINRRDNLRSKVTASKRKTDIENKFLKHLTSIRTSIGDLKTIKGKDVSKYLRVDQHTFKSKATSNVYVSLEDIKVNNDCENNKFINSKKAGRTMLNSDGKNKSPVNKFRVIDTGKIGFDGRIQLIDRCDKLIVRKTRGTIKKVTEKNIINESSNYSKSEDKLSPICTTSVSPRKKMMMSRIEGECTGKFNFKNKSSKVIKSKEKHVKNSTEVSNKVKCDGSIAKIDSKGTESKRGRNIGGKMTKKGESDVDVTAEPFVVESDSIDNSLDICKKHVKSHKVVKRTADTIKDKKFKMSHKSKDNSTGLKNSATLRRRRVKNDFKLKKNVPAKKDDERSTIKLRGQHIATFDSVACPKSEMTGKKRKFGTSAEKQQGQKTSQESPIKPLKKSKLKSKEIKAAVGGVVESRDNISEFVGKKTQKTVKDQETFRQIVSPIQRKSVLQEMDQSNRVGNRQLELHAKQLVLDDKETAITNGFASNKSSGKTEQSKDSKNGGHMTSETASNISLRLRQRKYAVKVSDSDDISIETKPEISHMKSKINVSSEVIRNRNNVSEKRQLKSSFEVENSVKIIQDVEGNGEYENGFLKRTVSKRNVILPSKHVSSIAADTFSTMDNVTETRKRKSAFDTNEIRSGMTVRSHETKLNKIGKNEEDESSIWKSTFVKDVHSRKPLAFSPEKLESSLIIERKQSAYNSNIQSRAPLTTYCSSPTPPSKKHSMPISNLRSTESPLRLATRSSPFKRPLSRLSGYMESKLIIDTEPKEKMLKLHDSDQSSTSDSRVDVATFDPNRGTVTDMTELERKVKRDIERTKQELIKKRLANKKTVVGVTREKYSVAVRDTDNGVTDTLGLVSDLAVTSNTDSVDVGEKLSVTMLSFANSSSTAVTTDLGLKFDSSTDSSSLAMRKAESKLEDSDKSRDISEDESVVQDTPKKNRCSLM